MDLTPKAPSAQPSALPDAAVSKTSYEDRTIDIFKDVCANGPLDFKAIGAKAKAMGLEQTADTTKPSPIAKDTTTHIQSYIMRSTEGKSWVIMITDIQGPLSAVSCGVLANVESPAKYRDNVKARMGFQGVGERNKRPGEKWDDTWEDPRWPESAMVVAELDGDKHIMQVKRVEVKSVTSKAQPTASSAPSEASTDSFEDSTIYKFKEICARGSLDFDAIGAEAKSLGLKLSMNDTDRFGKNTTLYTQLYQGKRWEILINRVVGSQASEDCAVLLDTKFTQNFLAKFKAQMGIRSDGYQTKGVHGNPVIVWMDPRWPNSALKLHDRADKNVIEMEMMERKPTP